MKCIWEIPVPISNLSSFIYENLEDHCNVSPFQLRLNENLRVSKFLFPVLGIDTDGWMHAVIDRSESAKVQPNCSVATPTDIGWNFSASRDSDEIDRQPINAANHQTKSP